MININKKLEEGLVNYSEKIQCIFHYTFGMYGSPIISDEELSVLTDISVDNLTSLRTKVFLEIMNKK